MSKSVTNTPEDLHRAGLLNTSIPVIFSHATFLTFRGAELLRLTDQYVSLTIESEMHYGHTHPISHLILSQASLGVDTHAAYSGDLLTQARIWLQSVRATLFADVLRHWETPSTSPMSVNQAFLLATRNGGLALRRPDLGIIAVGAKADLVVWDGDSPALLGWRDPIAAVMLHASVADVEHVLVGGEFIKRAGKLTAKGYADVKKKFLESARRVQEVFIEDRQSRPPREGEVFFEVGAPLVSAMQVDVQRGDGTGYGKVFV
jgi:cytosine/adenosine deaminase-related metal-dependent hydrolase